MSEFLFKSSFTIHHSTGDWEQQFYHSAQSFGEARQMARDKVKDNPGVTWKSTKHVLEIDKLKGGQFIEVSRQETEHTTP